MEIKRNARSFWNHIPLKSQCGFYVQNQDFTANFKASYKV